MSYDVGDCKSNVCLVISIFCFLQFPFVQIKGSVKVIKDRAPGDDGLINALKYAKNRLHCFQFSSFLISHFFFLAFSGSGISTCH